MLLLSIASVLAGASDPRHLRYLNISSSLLEVSGTMADLNLLLDEAQRKHTLICCANVLHGAGCLPFHAA